MIYFNLRSTQRYNILPFERRCDGIRRPLWLYASIFSLGRRFQEGRRADPWEQNELNQPSDELRLEHGEE